MVKGEVQICGKTRTDVRCGDMGDKGKQVTEMQMRSYKRNNESRGNIEERRKGRERKRSDV